VLSGDQRKWIDGPVTNNGRIEIGGTGELLLSGDTSIIENAALIELTSDQQAGTAAVSAAQWRLHNQVTGLIRKTAGAGTSRLQIPVDNDGTVRAESGVLALAGGTGTQVSTGRYGAAPGGPVLAFVNGIHKVDGALFADYGIVSLDAGELQGDFSVEPGATLRWTGGTLAGGPDAVVRPGAVVQSTGTAARTWRGSLRNEGTFLDSGDHTVGVGGNVDIRNAGLFDNSGALTTSCSCSASVIFNFTNEKGGVLRKSAGGRTMFIFALHNSGGEVIVEPGTTLVLTNAADIANGLAAPWRDTGTWTVRGTLGIFNRKPGDIGTHLVIDGPAATVASSIDNSGNATPALDGMYFVSGSLTVKGQMLSAPKGLTNMGTIVLGDNGRINANGDKTIFGNRGRLELAPTAVVEALDFRNEAGTVTGSGRFTGGVMNFGGTFSPTGVMTIDGLFQQGGNGVIEAVVGPTAPGRLSLSQPGRFNGGTLRVRVAPGATPAAGQSFTLVQGSLHRDFVRLDRIDTDDLGSGLTFVPAVTTSGVTVAVQAG
jgi:hypothetical protein